MLERLFILYTSNKCLAGVIFMISPLRPGGVLVGQGSRPRDSETQPVDGPDG